MDPDPEALLDERHQPGAGGAAVESAVVGGEVQHLGSDLVRSARSAPLWDQALQALPREGLDGAEAGRQGDAEVLGGLGQGELVEAHEADHLVADLQDVAGIEEVAVGEAGIADAFRVGVEQAGFAEAVRLAGGRVLHGSSCGIYYHK